MPDSPPAGMPRITPYLYYEDVPAMLEWLARAFGFRERTRLTGPEGEIVHAELEWAEGLVMVGRPSAEYRNPRNLGQVTTSLYVYVDAVDELFRRAKEAGADVIEEPCDQSYGDRRCGVLDPEGHEWYFAQHVRDVPESEQHPNQP